MTETISKALDYTPDADIQVHTEGAIKIICTAIQSHEAGLPEWAKNGSDGYVRTGAEPKDRVLVIFLDNGNSSRAPAVGCLDFTGMTSKVIEERFRIWADPNAAQREASADMQGGLGNGGKCYMTQLFEDYAVLHTVKGGLGCRYGVSGGSLNFGWVPDAATGRDFPVTDVEAELGFVLATIGASSKKLPPAAIDALRRRQGFTLVVGRGPKGYGKRIPYQPLVESLRDHAQMITTLELCDVYVTVNGAPLKDNFPISLPPLAPDPGFPDPRVLPLPGTLVDPATGIEVSTTDGGRVAAGELVLRTSNVSMRWSRKGRHTVLYRAVSGFIGYRPINELDVASTFKERIYGQCTLLSLESAKQNERARLANTPLTRAVEAWVAAQVQALALEFEARDKKSYSQAEKDGLSKINEALDRWKNRLLKDQMRGSWGPGGEIGGDPKKLPLPSGTPVRVEVHLNQQRAGIGVALRPAVHFFDRDERRIRPIPYEWISDDNNVAMVDSALNIINTFSPGKTTVSAKTLDGKLQSNSVNLEVVKIRKITLVPAEIELAEGSVKSIEALCELSNNDVVADVSLVWTEGNPAIARVSTSGRLFGMEVGETEVTAGDDRVMADSSVKVSVVIGEGKGPGEKSGGKGFPRILVSGVDKDPETDDIVTLSKDDPPILQRPQDADRNIWWINSSAPMARLYLNTSSGYGYKTREWRMYHIERYTDVMVQIAMTYGSDHGPLTPDEWIQKWGELVADFQEDAAMSLAGFIKDGDLSAVLSG